MALMSGVFVVVRCLFGGEDDGTWTTNSQFLHFLH